MLLQTAAPVSEPAFLTFVSLVQHRNVGVALQASRLLQCNMRLCGCTDSGV